MNDNDIVRRRHLSLQPPRPYDPLRHHSSNRGFLFFILLNILVI